MKSICRSRCEKPSIDVMSVSDNPAYELHKIENQQKESNTRNQKNDKNIDKLFADFDDIDFIVNYYIIIISFYIYMTY